MTIQDFDGLGHKGIMSLLGAKHSRILWDIEASELEELIGRYSHGQLRGVLLLVQAGIIKPKNPYGASVMAKLYALLEDANSAAQKVD
jgi:hypothetical protein